MKITKEYLRKIIKEEMHAKLNEGFKEIEIELIEDIVDMLRDRGAIRSDDPDDDGYAAAYQYLEDAVLPTLKDWHAGAAGESTGIPHLAFPGAKGKV